jgi:hypothetical protein
MKFHHQFTLTASTCLMAVGICAAQPTYRATPIQAAGSNFNRLEWLSDDGSRALGETGIVLEDGSRMQPCVQYKDGSFTNLPTPNFACSGVRGNNNGAFVGTLLGADPTSGFQAFLYQNDTFTLVAPVKPGEAGTSFAAGIPARRRRGLCEPADGHIGGHLPNPDEHRPSHWEPVRVCLFRWAVAEVGRQPTAMTRRWPRVSTTMAM